MYDKTTIKTLYSTNGWGQSPLAAYAIVDEANLVSKSGLKYQDFHKLVTIENLYNCAPEGLSDEDFNTWLRDLTKASVIKVINNLLIRQRPKSKDLLEHFRLYKYENRHESDNVIDNNGDTVGFEIELYNSNNLRLVLDSIGLSMTGTQALSVRVFHSHFQDAIETIAATSYATGEKWAYLSDTTEVSMYNMTSSYTGGKFYICYRQSDLGSNQAYKREWDRASWRECSRYFKIRPFKVSGWDETTRFDVEDVEYTSDSYGLNFEFSTHVDLTRFFSVHNTTIANLLGLQVAVDCLELFVNSTRTNALKQEVRDLAREELNTQEVGLRDRLQKELDAVDLDISGLDPVSLPEKSGKLRSYTMQ